MDILTDKWIPHINGHKLDITEASGISMDKLLIPRPEMRFALKLLAIGLHKTGCKKTSPFMQNDRALSGAVRPIETLLLDAASKNAIENNSDLFVKRNVHNAMCEGCATLALYTHCLFTNVGGKGLFAGVFANKIIYLHNAENLNQIAASNCTNKKIAGNPYFTPPNNYWLGTPERSGTCALCGHNGPVITEYHRAGGKKITGYTPHTASNSKKMPYSQKYAPTEMHIVDGCAPDSSHVTPPIEISDSGVTNSEINYFSTVYNNASLQNIEFGYFTISSAQPISIMNFLLASVFKYTHPDKKINYNCSILQSLAGNFSAEILSGSDPRATALKLYDEFCPLSLEPERNKILTHGRASLMGMINKYYNKLTETPNQLI